jgi:predicted O-linked N-acetylglucosamine transferase (SPINDLY family)
MASISVALQTALQHHQAGRLAQAADIYRRILAVEPDQPDALHLLGVILHQSGQHAEALDLLRRATTARPRSAVYHNSLGVALKDRGDLQAAAVSYRRAVELEPDYPDAQLNLARVLRALGDLASAAIAYQRAAALAPDVFEIHSSLGDTCSELGRLPEAIASYGRALELKPDAVSVYNNLGNAWQLAGNPDAAAACYRKALTLQPNRVESLTNLGTVLKNQGYLEEAAELYRRVLTLEPTQVAAHSNLLYALTFSADVDPAVLGAESRRWNEIHARPLAAQIRPHPNDRTPDRRLRVGYVSPDFREHPVGRMLLPLLEAHDHREFEIYAYSSVAAPDALTARARAAVDLWRDVFPLNDEQLAALVREDQIDILVDLTMHMAGSRLLVFARRPAPVQVTYLAYCGTTGLEAIDYRLTDPYLDPPGADESCYAEQSIRLPETYWCYRPTIEPPPVGPLPAAATGCVTFGCLNNFCKVSTSALETWARLLAAVPGARLLVHAHPGSHRQRALAVLAQHGVSPDRLEFIDFMPAVEYFRVYQRIDVALDPFPYGGGTTTCDALWMGVPAVTLAGRTAVGRGGVSILSNIGLPEFIAHDPAEYVRLATDLATDQTRLAQLRAGLRDRLRNSPLTDAPRFARNVEAAYRTMWRGE